MAKIPLKEYVRLLRRYLAPQRGAAGWMAALLCASIALKVVAPQIVRAFIDSIQGGEDEAVLAGAALVFIAMTIAQRAASVLATYWSERVAWTATNALRADLVAHLIRLDPGFHKTRTSGELIERVDGDVNALAAFFSSFVVQLIGSGLFLAGVLIAMLLIDARLGLIFTAFAMLAVWLLGWVRRFATPYWQTDREHSAAFYGYIGEVLTATEDIRSSGAVPYAMRRFFVHLRGWLPVKRRAELLSYGVWMTAIAVFAAGDAIAYGLGGGLHRLGSISRGSVCLIVAYTAMLAEPLETIRTQLQQLQRADAGIVRVRELLETRSRLNDGTRRLPAGALAVEFRAVHFGYEHEPVADGRLQGAEASIDLQSDNRIPQSDYALSNVTFRLEAGRVLGLLGRTGSGKTTIARLLFRLYDPQQGEVCVGGINVRQARLDALRARIGLVTQDVQLFETTLRDNITFFDRGISDGYLLSILETLGLESWLARLPAGLDTMISGARLSAGEAQLVAFARVFLKDPGLVILDEASSRLDPATESLLERALDRLLHGRTVIIIAHRMATVERAGELLILEDGRIVEHGPYASLDADPNSRFAQMRQAGSTELLA